MGMFDGRQRDAMGSGDEQEGRQARQQLRVRGEGVLAVEDGEALAIDLATGTEHVGAEAFVVKGGSGAERIALRGAGAWRLGLDEQIRPDDGAQFGREREEARGGLVGGFRGGPARDEFGGREHGEFFAERVVVSGGGGWSGEDRDAHCVTKVMVS